MTKRRSSTDPKRTLQLLDDLEKLGFDNGALKILHHKSANGETIKSHRKFCEGREFPFEENRLDSQVQQRLEFVLREFKALGFDASDDEEANTIFHRLAKASIIAVPIVRKR